MKAYTRWRWIVIACFLAALIFVPPCAMEPSAAARSPIPASQGKQTGSASGTQVAKGKVKKPRSRKKSSRRRRRQGQLRPTPSRIAEIQSALIQKGYLKGEPTSVWDAQSTAAMQRFQEASGLEPTGRLDARSLIKLGLGPETAGAGAPRSPAAQPSPSAPQAPSNPTSPPR